MLLNLFPILSLFLFAQDTNARPQLSAPILIKGGTVVVEPGRNLQDAGVLIEDGRIAAVGSGLAPAPGTREIDAAGAFIYPALIDAFTRVGLSESKLSAADERRVEDEFESASEGPRLRFESANRNGIFARRHVEELIDLQDVTYAKFRNAGFAVANVAPPQGILGGHCAVLTLGDRPLRRSLLETAAMQTASFSPPSPRSLAARDRYPSTTFGVMAHFRQTMMDAQWFRSMREYVKNHPEAAGELPHDDDLDALQAVLSRKVPLAWEADDVEEIHRALNLAGEFRLQTIIVGGREAGKAVERLRATKTPVVLALSVPKKPDDYKFDSASLGRAKDSRELLPAAWQKRPFLPASAYAHAAKQRDEELKTAMALENAGVPWCISTHGLGQPADALQVLRELVEAGMKPEAALRALTTVPARLLGIERDFGTVEKGKRASLAIFSKPIEDKSAQLRFAIVDGAVFEFDPFADRGGGRGPGAAGGRGRGRGQGRSDSSERKPAEEPAAESAKAKSETASAPASIPASAPATPDALLAHAPSWALETNADRESGLRTNGNVLLKNALALPVSGDELPNTSILVEEGKIKAIGANLSAPPGTFTIDLSGYTVMPGIIDPHAHIALDSVNEATLSVVPEVRCEDVVRPTDVDIYRALAGGVTMIHSMHGSANTIGGQNVLMKLKWGRPASEMIVHDRVRTVKFATGENVTRGGRPTGGRGPANPERARRFPGTRMGVETVMRRALQAGREYDQKRQEAADSIRFGKDAKPLRRDLRLEALADIVTGAIWINCHCYRADEILRLLAVAEDFGVRVGALHHCLEAYRIMPEIARHGVGTATFSDWWAYKIEAYDAVPQNAAMLLKAGVNSTIKSDSSDLMRHMTLEAAKSLRFGGLSAREALSIVTANPAKLFGMEKRTGTIEVGKDADLAVFDGHPLDTFGKCVLTFVDGECYFRHRDFDLNQPRKPQHRAGDFANRSVGMPALENGVRRLNDAGAYALVGGTIHPVSGPPIERGTLVMRNGRIESVGTDLVAPADATIVSVSGMHVWPGVINAASTVGMYEIGAVDVTLDTSDAGMYMPDLTAISGLNPHSAMIEVARAEGTTTSLLTPSGSRIAGQASLAHLAGWTANEMLIDARMGLVVRLPSKSIEPILDRKPALDRDSEFEEMRNREREDERAVKDLRELEEFFRDARLYAQRRRADAHGPAGDPRFEAMVPYALGEKPVLFDADSYKTILEALMFAERYELKAMILGGREAWKCADILAARKVPVLFEGVFAIPSEVAGVPMVGDAWDAQYRAPGVLAAAGVPFALVYRDASLAKNLPLIAGFAVAHGLSEEAAVRAITLSPAELLGMADQLGSLAPGRVADVVVTRGHLCQAAAKVEYLFVWGKPVPLETKHSRDAERFQHRPVGEIVPPRNDLKGPAPQSGRSE